MSAALLEAMRGPGGDLLLVLCGAWIGASLAVLATGGWRR